MRNIEKLKNYFFGKDPQLRETMADNSLRLIGIKGKNFVLRTELLKRLKELKEYVDGQDEALQSNINAVIEDLEAEELARSGADTTLQTSINNEKLARENADTRLGNRIDGNANDIADLKTWKDNTAFVVEADLDNFYTKTETEELAKHTYSTTEQEVGTWIDGKTLYEKVITATVPANGYETVGIALGVDKLFIKQAQAVVTKSYGKDYFQVPHYSSNVYHRDILFAITESNHGAVALISNVTSEAADFEIVVNYTKTLI